MASLAPRILKRKTKTLSFRMSSEDYERLRTFCVSTGQRSVSDLARMAVRSLLDSGDRPDLETRLADVEGRMFFLTRELVRLAEPNAKPAP